MNESTLKLVKTIEEVIESGVGQQAVDFIKALDKSTAPVGKQLQDACQFLGLEWTLQSKREDISAGVSDDNAGQWLPREEWVLRWLLKRMKNEGEKAWGLECFYSHAETWTLMGIASAKLMPRIMSNLLHEFGFESILEKSLAGLAKASQSEQFVAVSDGQGDDGSPRPAKRQRTENGERAVQKPSCPQDVLDNMATLITILIRRSDGVWGEQDEGIKLAKNLLRLCIKFPPLNAIAVLGSCLTALCNLRLSEIEHPLLPMLDLYDMQKPTFEDDPKIREIQIAFAKSIMIPALQLLDDHQRQLTSALHARLKILLRQGFYTPAQAVYSEKKAEEAEMTHFKDMITAAMFPCEADPSLLSGRLQSFIKYAIVDTETESTKQRIQAIRRVEPLVLHIRHSLRELVESKRIQQTEFTSIMESLLVQLDKKSLRLSPDILTKMVQEDCGLVRGQDVYHVGWNLLAICIDTNPRFAIDAVTENEGNTLITLISDALRHDKTFVKDSKRNVILGICQAFLRTRRLSTFVKHWQAELTRSDEDKPVDNPWADDWTIVELGRALRESLLTLQIANSLDELLKSQLDLVADSNSATAELSYLIQIRCLLAALGSTHSEARSEQACKTALHQVLSLLTTGAGRSAVEAWHIAIAALQIGGVAVASTEDAYGVLKLTDNLRKLKSQNDVTDSSTRLILLLQFQYRSSFLKLMESSEQPTTNGHHAEPDVLQSLFQKIEPPAMKEEQPLKSTEMGNLAPKSLHLAVFYETLANIDAGILAPSSVLGILDPVFEVVSQQTSQSESSENSDSGLRWSHAWQILVQISNRLGDKALSNSLSKIHTQYLDSVLEKLHPTPASFDTDRYVFFVPCLLQLGVSGLSSQHRRKIAEGLCSLLKITLSEDTPGPDPSNLRLLEPTLSLLTLLSRNSPTLQTYIREFGLPDSEVRKAVEQEAGHLPSEFHALDSVYTLFSVNETETRKRLNKYIDECETFASMESAARAQEIMARAEQIRDDSSEEAANLIVLYLQLVRKEEDKSDEVKLAITRCMNRILTRLEREIDGVYFLQLVKIMHRILQNHQKSVIQWHADEVMATIAIATRPHCAKIEDCDLNLARLLFTALCRLFATLIANHRKRLGGRFHLILAATKSMTNCLFMPHKPKDDTRPAWLTQFPGQPLLPEHAGAISRIITSLSDPTASAAARSSKKKGNNLNDAVKAAKAHNARFLRFAIIDFCRCQVQGRLLPEMRTALNPGLYSIMDILKPELRSNVNNRLDTNGKGIFKAFYEDYRRQKEQLRS